MKKLIIAAGLIVALGITEHTQAQVRVNVNLGIGAPVYYPAPRPVVVYDDPYAVCAPRPVVVVPVRQRYGYYNMYDRDRYYDRDRRYNDDRGRGHGRGHGRGGWDRD
jgi:hypothetical protein